ncbi:hypothetical protein [Luteolibacter soli]|uniref:Uncharacterized protein n=1 Tax=Luteolibacter soli TaxID=3135280 RepID=A0ABU9AY00_9BACT
MLLFTALVPGEVSCAEDPATKVTEEGRAYSSKSLGQLEVATKVKIFNLYSISRQFSLRLEPSSCAILFASKPLRLAAYAFIGRGLLTGKVSPVPESGTLEGTIEFGDGYSFDSGLMAGGVYVMGGAYVSMGCGGVNFSVYQRAGVQVKVLGVIEVSSMLFLGFSHLGG